MSRTGKTYFITGGASGLGLATARKLHREGANVTIADLNEKAGKALEAEFGERCLFQKVDVTKEEQVAAAVENTVKTFGTLNGCVNSAGLGAAETTVSRDGKPMRSKTWDFVMKINAYGTFYGSAYCAAAMSKLPADADGNRGVIVNVSSIAGIEGQKGQLVYSASKGAVIGMTRIAVCWVPQIYQQLEQEFGVSLEKPQKKIIKSLVLDVVEEQNNA